MYVYVKQDVGSATAPVGAVVDASGWPNLNDLLNSAYVRPASPDEVAKATKATKPADEATPDEPKTAAPDDAHPAKHRKGSAS